MPEASADTPDADPENPMQFTSDRGSAPHPCATMVAIVAAVVATVITVAAAAVAVTDRHGPGPCSLCTNFQMLGTGYSQLTGVRGPPRYTRVAGTPGPKEQAARSGFVYPAPG